MIDSKVKKKEIAVRVWMGRDNHGRWRIQIDDDSSCLRILDVRMDDKQFSDFMAHSQSTGEGEYYAHGNIGKTMKTLTYHVLLKNVGEDMLKDHERDMKFIYDYAEEKNPGYKADREAYNGHRRDWKNGTYSVLLRTYE